MLFAVLKKFNPFLNCLLLLFFLTFLPCEAKTQNHKGNICGIVADQQGLRIGGVKITVKDKNSNLEYSSVSNDDGIFFINNLQTNNYEVTLKKDGFDPYITRIIVNENITTLLDCSLKAGSFVDVIEVSPSNSSKVNEKEAINELKYLTLRDNIGLSAVSREMPVYPLSLMKNRIEGEIYIGTIVNAEGKVTKTVFLGGDIAFAISATAAIEKWVFQKSEHGFFGYIGFRYIINKQAIRQSEDIFLTDNLPSTINSSRSINPIEMMERGNPNIKRPDSYKISVIK